MSSGNGERVVQHADERHEEFAVRRVQRICIKLIRGIDGVFDEAQADTIFEIISDLNGSQSV